MGVNLVTTKSLISNVRLTDKGTLSAPVWDAVSDLTSTLSGGAGNYCVDCILRGQIRISPATGQESDYISLSASLWLDGVMISGSETMLLISVWQQVVGCSVSPPWEISWDGTGPGVLEIRFQAFYNPGTRDNSNDVVLIPTDQYGRCWVRVTKM